MKTNPIPDGFSAVQSGVPTLPPEMKTRFVGMYPIDSGQYAISTGAEMLSSGANDDGVLAWLLTHLPADSTDVIVLDVQTNRAWRANYASAMEFMARVNAAPVQA